jgi:hypothetical protein
MLLISRKGAVAGFLFFGLALSGCASVDSSDYRQTILVTSDPPGAEVFDRGELIGVTPAYVRVRRRLHPEIIIRFPGNPERRIELPTHYRWGDSFGTNFIILFAPIGWAVDWLTGNAWRMDDPPTQEFRGKARSKPSPDIVAIAPPLTVDSDTSDALGTLLERKISALGSKTLAYNDTVSLFDYYGSDHGLSRNPKLRYNLFYQLGANQVFLSKAEPTENGYLVKGQLHDIYTGHDGTERSWEITTADGSLRTDMNQHRFFNEYFHIFPNTLFLNLASYQPSLQIENQSYLGKSARREGALGEALSYISYIGLAHMDRPRADIRGRWTFDFVPLISASEKKIFFDNYQPLTGAEFDRLYLSAGYGIEVGHLSRIGFFYLDIVPTPAYTDIRYTWPDGQGRASRFSITTDAELGYSRFLNDHFIAKVFVRSVSEDAPLWAEAIHDISQKDEVVNGLSSVYAGVALGYYIPSSLNRKHSWQAVEKR